MNNNNYQDKTHRFSFVDKTKSNKKLGKYIERSKQKGKYILTLNTVQLIEMNLNQICIIQMQLKNIKKPHNICPCLTK